MFLIGVLLFLLYLPVKVWYSGKGTLKAILCFILNKIKYQDPSIGTDEELVAKEVSIYITIDGDIVYRFNSNFKKKTAKQLNELFDEIVTSQTKPSISDVNINKYTNELDKMNISIKYKITETKSDELNVKLTATEEFTI